MIPENIKLLIDLTLGDGWIGYNGSSVRGRIEHSIKQKEYAQHKEQLLKNVGLPVASRQYISTTKKNTGFEYYQVNLLSHRDLHTAYKWIYNKGRKALDKSLLRNCDARTLAYLYMDDGHAKLSNYCLGKYEKFIYSQAKVHCYRLSTNNFNYEEHLLFQDWLLSLGVTSTLERQGNSHRTIIGTEEAKDTFRALVSEFIVPSMQYKIANIHSFKDVSFVKEPRENRDRKRLSEETLSNDNDATVQ